MSEPTSIRRRDRRLRAGRPDSSRRCSRAAATGSPCTSASRDIYKLPRAVYFDDEIMQVWQTLGITFGPRRLCRSTTYKWFGADGETILRMEHPGHGPSGWEPGYSFYQPNLERALDGRCSALPTADGAPRLGAEALVQAARSRRADAAPRARAGVRGRRADRREDDGPRALRRSAPTARTRSCARPPGIGFEDQGFAERWLVIDLQPDDVDALSTTSRRHASGATRSGRTCTPATAARTGASSSCWCPASVPRTSPTRPRLGAAGAVVHTGGRDASCAQTSTSSAGGWRRRCAPAARCSAGDAAHTMPPFMGQGLCSGVRDATNLAWRLDLIVRGLGRRRAARRLHGRAASRTNEWIVNLSTEMGRVSCVLDAGRRRARRDAAGVGDAADDGAAAVWRRARWPRRPPLAGDGGAGRGPRCGGRAGRFDDVVGNGFVLVARRSVDAADEQVAFLEWIGARRRRPRRARGSRRPSDRLARRAPPRRRADPARRTTSSAPSRRSRTLPALVDDLRSQLAITNRGSSPMSTDLSSTRSSITSISRRPACRR